MKRTGFARIWMAMVAATVVLSAALLTAQQSDSLGDYARAVRKDKKPAPAKSYDNDNLPRQEKLSVVGNATDSADKSAPAGNASEDAQNADQSDKPPQIKPGQTPAERQKAIDAWKTKIDAQKEKMDAATRELDLLQREYRLRAAAFYGDAGARLRNSGEWDKEDSSYKSQLDDKQKAVNDAKQQLEDLQEQARKAGLPNSANE
jgi:hypothetical protein